MNASFATVPSGARSSPQPFKVSIPEEQLKEFHQLLRLSKIGPKTFESEQTDGRYGITRDWLINAKAAWEKWNW
jgi:microsomal epoxide hydrolase